MEMNAVSTAEAQANVDNVWMRTPGIPAFEERNPGLIAYMIQQAANGSSFCESLLRSLKTHGGLTDRQIGAVKNGMAKAKAPVAAVNVQPIVDCLKRGLAKGLKAPKINLRKFAFNLAKPDSANPGAVYIKEGGVYLGKIINSELRLLPAYGDRVDAIAEVAIDPESEAIAYGKEYGLCALCNRDLSDPESVARGIGPVCAAKYFD